MSRIKKFNKDEALKKALELFWKKGYEATSLSDLTMELGIGKGSFYNTFGSKRELFDSCLAVYREGGISVIVQILNSENDPILGIRKFLDFQTENLLIDPYAKGCLIANTSAEMAYDKKIASFLKENNQIMKSKIVAYLSDSSLSKQAAAIADAVLIYTTGVSIISKFMKDLERLKAANEQFLKSLLN